MTTPNILGAVLVALAAALPVAIVQPPIQAIPWLEAILAIASPTVTAIALYLRLDTGKAE